MNDKLFQASESVHVQALYEELPGQDRITWSAEGNPAATIFVQPGSNVALALYRAGNAGDTALLKYLVPCSSCRRIKRVEFVITYDDEELP